MQATQHTIHHAHLRKRLYKNLEPYPHPDKYKNMIDKLIYVIGFLGILLTIPQVVKIFAEKNASGLSLITWLSYLFGSLLWFAYGFFHREHVIVIANALAFFFNLFIVIGIILYGIK